MKPKKRKYSSENPVMKELTRIMFHVADFQKALGEFSTSQLEAFRRELTFARNVTKDQLLFICAVRGFPQSYLSAREEDIRNELDRRICLADSWIDDEIPTKKRKLASFLAAQ